MRDDVLDRVFEGLLVKNGRNETVGTNLVFIDREGVGPSPGPSAYISISSGTYSCSASTVGPQHQMFLTGDHMITDHVSVWATILFYLDACTPAQRNDFIATDYAISMYNRIEDHLRVVPASGQHALPNTTPTLSQVRANFNRMMQIHCPTVDMSTMVAVS